MKGSIPLSPVSTVWCQLGSRYSASLTAALPGENGCLFAIPPCSIESFHARPAVFGLGGGRFMKGSIPLSPVSTEWCQLG